LRKQTWFVAGPCSKTIGARTGLGHGSEHLYIDDLQSLCAVCHRMVHGEVIEATLLEWQLAAYRPASQYAAQFQLVKDGFWEQAQDPLE